MGFNKRYFSKEAILINAQSNEYEVFKRWMLNPDSCIFEDGWSNEKWQSFANGNEETKRTIYKTLRNEA
jgi:hypothetical protein